MSVGKDILQSETPLDRLYIRRANSTDNKRKIAELIFYTDPYIYPAAFENVETAQDAFPFFGLFDFKNILVAIKNGEIVGIAVICSGDNESIDPEPLMANHKTLPKGFKTVCEQYFNQLKDFTEKNVYIACLSVDKDHRGSGIGKSILEYVFHHYPGAIFSLDVVDGNPAEKLYLDVGFEEISHHPGFALGEQKPLVNTLIRKELSNLRQMDLK